jgi:hypothetical protein
MKKFYVRAFVTYDRRIEVYAEDIAEARRKWDQGKVFHECLTELFIPSVEPADDGKNV